MNIVENRLLKPNSDCWIIDDVISYNRLSLFSQERNHVDKKKMYLDLIIGKSRSSISIFLQHVYDHNLWSVACCQWLILIQP
jgi:hypothetical protein